MLVVFCVVGVLLFGLVHVLAEFCGFEGVAVTLGGFGVDYCAAVSLEVWDVD